MTKSRSEPILMFTAALFIFALPGIVNACSYAIDPANPTADPHAERNYYGQFFFIGVWVVLTANILFATFTRKKYLLGIVLSMLALPIQFVWLVFTLFDSCGFLYHKSIRIEFWILVLALAAQIIWFVKMRRRESIVFP